MLDAVYSMGSLIPSMACGQCKGAAVRLAAETRHGFEVQCGVAWRKRRLERFAAAAVAVQHLIAS